MKVNSKLSLSMLAVSAALATPTVLAQEQQESATTERVERIQVTGSRINRTSMEGASQVEVIDRDRIEASGFNNLQQILERLPAALPLLLWTTGKTPPLWALKWASLVTQTKPHKVGPIVVHRVASLVASF